MEKQDTSDRAATRRLPWTVSGRLVSLLELMQIINAERLYRLGVMSGATDVMVMTGPKDQVSGTVPKRGLETLRETLSQQKTVCDEANLRISVMAIDEFMDKLETRADSITFEDVRVFLNELSSTVRRELQCSIVLCLNPKRSEFYKAKNLFGQDVAVSFPSAAFDIEEAGNCLATERSTATVFHLNRVAEVGLRALGGTLKEPHLDASRNPTWEAILCRCDDELRKPRKDRSSDWQTEADFFAEATARLRSVKDAWRNPTMHVEKKYTPDEAQDIYNAIRAFMRHLATKLKE